MGSIWPYAESSNLNLSAFMFMAITLDLMKRSKYFRIFFHSELNNIEQKTLLFENCGNKKMF